jgi:ADP-ribose pyrophosphatase YjhB (NUDIX family)
MTRAYPNRPVLGVGAVIFVGDRVVLIRRRQPPMQGEWSIPGGSVELGESLEGALRREMREETGLEIEVGPQIEIFERVEHDDDGRIRFHHVIVDFACRAVGGTLRAADDAEEVALADPANLEPWRLGPSAVRVIARAAALRDRMSAFPMDCDAAC